MEKFYFERFTKRLSVLPILLMAVLSIGLVSCGGSDDKDDEPILPPSSPTSVTIINNSVSTLNRFRVVFLNSTNEIITDKDYGTLAPRDQISAPIPTGATQYYMATYLSSTWFFSVNYNVSYTTMSLTDAVVGEWRSNASTIAATRAAEEAE